MALADHPTEMEPVPEPRVPWWTPAALSLIFVGILMSEEMRVLSAITPDGVPRAKLSWLSLWPLAWLSMALLAPWRLRWCVLAAVTAVSVALMATDAGYWAFFRTVAPLNMFASVHQLSDVQQSVEHLLEPGLVLPLLFTPVYLLYAFWGRRRTAALPIGRQHGRLARVFAQARTWGVVLSLAFAAQLFVALNSPIFEDTHHLNRPKWVLPAQHWGSKYSDAIFARTFGLYNFHVVDLFRALRARLVEPPFDDVVRAAVRQHLVHKQTLNNVQSPFFGIAKGRNVVIVQMESLQHFLLGLEVGGEAVVPVLNQLSKRALNWNYIMDVTLHGRTSDAEYALMTGLPPDRVKAMQFQTLSEHLPALPRSLAGLGYETLAIHGYDVTFWNRARAFPRYGFEHLYFQESFAQAPKWGLGPADEVVFEFAVDRMQKRSAKNVLSLIVTLSSHHPYVYVPERYLQPFSEAFPDLGLTGPYLGSAAYADEALGGFMARMQKAGLWDNTLFVIYGDHDRGGLGTNEPIPSVGPAMFLPQGDRIPFMIVLPGKEQFIAQHFAPYANVFGSLRDVFPTVMHLLGEAVPYGVTGTHLFVDNAQRDAVAHRTDQGSFFYRGVLANANGELWAPEGLPAAAVDWPQAWNEAMQEQLLMTSFPLKADADLLAPP